MSIYFRQAAAAEGKSAALTALESSLPLAQQPRSSVSNEFPAPQPAADETVVRIDMKNVKSDVILTEFLAKTGATPVKPTAYEEQEMRQVAEREERAAYDRTIGKNYMLKVRTEERQRQAALDEAEAIKAANL